MSAKGVALPRQWEAMAALAIEQASSDSSPSFQIAAAISRAALDADIFSPGKLCRQMALARRPLPLKSLPRAEVLLMTAAAARISRALASDAASAAIRGSPNPPSAAASDAAVAN